MIKPRLQLVDTEAVAVHYKVAVGTVGRWASQDKWHRYGDRRNRLWDLAEAQRSYLKRHPEAGPAS